MISDIRGKIIQVVQAETTTPVTVTTTTFADTTLTATITPTSTKSKILIMFNQNFLIFRLGVNIGHGVRLVLGASTLLKDYGADGSERSGFIGVSSGTAVEHIGIYSNDFIHSPASVSAQTYKIQGRPNRVDDGGLVVYQTGGSPSTMTLMEILL